MAIFVDIHTHRIPTDPGTISLVCLEQGRIGGQVGDKIRYCRGIHPWNAASPGSEDEFREISVAARSGQIAAIGESGLDKIRLDAAFQAQLGMFRRHAILAEETTLPLVIHSVRSNSDILAEFARIRPRAPWIIHGFWAASTEIGRIVSNGILVSLGPRELAHPGASERIRQIPLDSLFLETDDSKSPIESVYRLASDACGCELDELVSRLHSNWIRVFGP